MPDARSFFLGLASMLLLLGVYHLGIQSGTSSSTAMFSQMQKSLVPRGSMVQSIFMRARSILHNHIPYLQIILKFLGSLLLLLSWLVVIIIVVVGGGVVDVVVVVCLFM